MPGPYQAPQIPGPPSVREPLRVAYEQTDLFDEGSGLAGSNYTNASGIATGGSLGSGSTWVYDATLVVPGHPMGSLVSVTTNSANRQVTMRGIPTDGTGQAFGALTFQIGSWPVNNNTTILNFKGGSGATVQASLVTTTANKLALRDVTTVRYTSTLALSAGVTYTVEIAIDQPAQKCQMRIWDAQANLLEDSGPQTFTLGGAANAFNVGYVSSPGATTTMLVPYWGYSTVDWVGPPPAFPAATQPLSPQPATRARRPWPFRRPPTARHKFVYPVLPIPGSLTSTTWTAPQGTYAMPAARTSCHGAVTVDLTACTLVDADPNAGSTGLLTASSDCTALTLIGASGPTGTNLGPFGVPRGVGTPRTFTYVTNPNTTGAFISMASGLTGCTVTVDGFTSVGLGKVVTGKAVDTSCSVVIRNVWHTGLAVGYEALCSIDCDNSVIRGGGVNSSPMGLHFNQDAAQLILWVSGSVLRVTNSEVTGFTTTGAGFLQGDAILAESSCEYVYIDNVYAGHNSDSGILDSKAAWGQVSNSTIESDGGRALASHCGYITAGNRGAWNGIRSFNNIINVNTAVLSSGGSTQAYQAAGRLEAFGDTVNLISGARLAQTAFTDAPGSGAAGSYPRLGHIVLWDVHDPGGAQITGPLIDGGDGSHVTVLQVDSQAALVPREATVTRRQRVPWLRRLRGVVPVKTQAQTPTTQALPPQPPTRARLRPAFLRRGRNTSPVLGPVTAPPGARVQQAQSRHARPTPVVRPRSTTPPPVPAPTPPPVRGRHAAPPKPRRGYTAQTVPTVVLVAGTQALPPQPATRPRRPWLFRRPRPSVVLPTQPVLTQPLVPQSVPARRRPVLFRRARTASPVPVQTVVTAQALPPQPQRTRRPFLFRRGRAAVPVPAPVVATTTQALPPQPARRSLFPLRARRTRTVAPPSPTVTTPPVTGRHANPGWIGRRRTGFRTSTVPVVQTAPPQPRRRRHARPSLIRRAWATFVQPNQAAPIVPSVGQMEAGNITAPRMEPTDTDRPRMWGNE